MWILVAIDFGPENPIFLAKSDIFIPKCTNWGWGESTGLGSIPKRTIFYAFPSNKLLSFIVHRKLGFVCRDKLLLDALASLKTVFKIK